MKLPSQRHLHREQRHTMALRACLTHLCGALYECTTSPQVELVQVVTASSSLLLMVRILRLPHYWQTSPSFTKETLAFQTESPKFFVPPLGAHLEIHLCFPYPELLVLLRHS